MTAWPRQASCLGRAGRQRGEREGERGGEGATHRLAAAFTLGLLGVATGGGRGRVLISLGRRVGRVVGVVLAGRVGLVVDGHLLCHSSASRKTAGSGARGEQQNGGDGEAGSERRWRWCKRQRLRAVGEQRRGYRGAKTRRWERSKYMGRGRTGRTGRTADHEVFYVMGTAKRGGAGRHSPAHDEAPGERDSSSTTTHTTHTRPHGLTPTPVSERGAARTRVPAMAPRRRVVAVPTWPRARCPAAAAVEGPGTSRGSDRRRVGMGESGRDGWAGARGARTDARESPCPASAPRARVGGWRRIDGEDQQGKGYSRADRPEQSVGWGRT